MSTSTQYSKIIGKEADDYVDKLYGKPGVSEAQRCELRLAFAAGAIVMFETAVEISKLPVEQAQTPLHRTHEGCYEFAFDTLKALALAKRNQD